MPRQRLLCGISTVLLIFLAACAPAAPSPTPAPAQAPKAPASGGPAEAKPAEAKPAEATKPAAAKPAEAPKPAEAKPAASPAAAPAPAQSPAAQPAPTTAPAAKPAGPMQKLRVAMGPLDFTKMNYLKWVEQMRAEGVADIELVPFENSAQLAQATVSGATQLQLNTLLSVIQLAQQGGPEMAFIATALQSPDYILVSRKNVENLAALQGKKLGISTPGDISDSLARSAFKRANIDVEKVQFVRVGGTGARMTALQQGSIDAGMAHVAEGLIAISKSPDLKNLASLGTLIPEYIQFGMATKREFIAGNKDLVQKLVDGFLDANRWAARNKAEYIAMAKKEIRGFGDVDEKLLSDSYDLFTQIKMFAVNGGLHESVTKTTVTLDQEAGTLKDAVPDSSKWLDASFVNDYLRRKGSL